MTYFNKRYHPPGTSPGTLVEQQDHTRIPFSLSLMDYTDAALTEKQMVAFVDCIPYLQSDSITWIHGQGDPDADSLRDMGELFDLHALSLEDILNTGQRPKMDSFDDQLFIVMSLPVLSDARVSTEQVSLFVGKGYVISFHRGTVDPFEQIRKRLRKHSGKIRSRQADYLLYTLIDAIIDEGFPVLEEFGDHIESLEEEILYSPDKQTPRKLHELKRELLMLRRMLWPQREVLNLLIRDDFSVIDSTTIVYLRDCYDHTIQIMDLIESYRDMSASMFDVYLTSVSNRMNEVMKVLTVIATIFIPLTFITGIYGMNFDNPDSPWAMPELHTYFGYPAVWGVMLVVTIGMAIYFKRKGWF
ncbi:MAG: magnesium/cobalt transporter CorA [Gammaproteobacteria bacterium]